MIDLETSYVYETVNGKKVIILPKSKDVNGKPVFIGIVEGNQAYTNYTKDGKVFSGTSQDKEAELKFA